MILIGESGATRTDWALVDENGLIEHSLTEGINPYFQSRKIISHTIRLQLPPIFFKAKFSEIFFYGAGCTTQQKKDVVKASLESQFRTPAFVESDMLGAAQALFADQQGIACKLGTGSNSCFYDGNKIVRNVKPLGYILGDEGSGASMGKVFLSDCLKGLAPQELVGPFYEKFKIDEEHILDYIYTKPFPSRLLSVLSFFLSENLDHAYVYDLVYNNIKSFFVRNVMQYEGYDVLPVKFVGTVASAYSQIIQRVAGELGINLEAICKHSIEGLVDFHKQKLVYENM